MQGHNNPTSNLIEYLQIPGIQQKLNDNAIQFVEGLFDPSRLLNDLDALIRKSGNETPPLPAPLQHLMDMFALAVQTDVREELKKDEPGITMKAADLGKMEGYNIQAIKALYPNLVLLTDYVIAVAITELFESDGSLKPELDKAIQAHLRPIAIVNKNNKKSYDEMYAQIKAQILGGYILTIIQDTAPITNPLLQDIRTRCETLSENGVERVPHLLYDPGAASYKYLNDVNKTINSVDAEFIQDADRKLQELSLKDSPFKEAAQRLLRTNLNSIMHRLMEKTKLVLDPSMRQEYIESIKEMEKNVTATTIGETIAELRIIEIQVDYVLVKTEIDFTLSVPTKSEEDRKLRQSLQHIVEKAETDLENHTCSREKITERLRLAKKAYDEIDFVLMAKAELIQSLQNPDYDIELRGSANVLLVDIQRLLLQTKADPNHPEQTIPVLTQSAHRQQIADILNQANTVLISSSNAIKGNRVKRLQLPQQLLQLSQRFDRIDLEANVGAIEDGVEKNRINQYLANVSYLEQFLKDAGDDANEIIAESYRVISKILSEPTSASAQQNSNFYFNIAYLARTISDIDDVRVKDRAEILLTGLITAKKELDQFLLASATQALLNWINNSNDVELRLVAETYNNLIKLARVLGRKENPLAVSNQDVLNQILGLVKHPAFPQQIQPAWIMEVLIVPAIQALERNNPAALDGVLEEIKKKNYNLATIAFDSAATALDSELPAVKSARNIFDAVQILRASPEADLNSLTKLLEKVTEELKQDEISESNLLFSEVEILLLQEPEKAAYVNYYKNLIAKIRTNNVITIDPDNEIAALRSLITFIKDSSEENRYALVTSISTLMLYAEDKEEGERKNARQEIVVSNRSLLDDIAFLKDRQAAPYDILISSSLSLTEAAFAPYDDTAKTNLEIKKNQIEFLRKLDVDSQIGEKPSANDVVLKFLNYRSIFTKSQDEIQQIYQDLKSSYEQIEALIAAEEKLNQEDPALDIAAKQRREQRILNLIAGLRSKGGADKESADYAFYNAFADDLKNKFEAFDTTPSVKRLWEFTFTADKDRPLWQEIILLPKFKGPLLLDIFKGIGYGLMVLSGLPLLRFIVKAGIEFPLLMVQKGLDSMIERAHRYNINEPGATLAAKILPGAAIGVAGFISYAAKSLRVWLRTATSPERSAKEGREIGRYMKSRALGNFLAATSIFSSIATYAAIGAVAAIYAIPAMAGSSVTWIAAAGKAMSAGLSYVGAKILAGATSALSYVGAKVTIPAAISLGPIAVNTALAVATFSISLAVPVFAGLRYAGGKIADGITNGWNKLMDKYDAYQFNRRNPAPTAEEIAKFEEETRKALEQQEKENELAKKMEKQFLEQQIEAERRANHPDIEGQVTLSLDGTSDIIIKKPKPAEPQSTAKMVNGMNGQHPVPEVMQLTLPKATPVVETTKTDAARFKVISKPTIGQSIFAHTTLTDDKVDSSANALGRALKTEIETSSVGEVKQGARIVGQIVMTFKDENRPTAENVATLQDIVKSYNGSVTQQKEDGRIIITFDNSKIMAAAMEAIEGIYPAPKI